jgi:hypothetical protein
MAKPMSAAQWRTQMKKWSVPFQEHAGWTTNYRPGSFAPVGVVIHHTGSDSGQNSESYDNFLFDIGRPAEGIPGPLCQSACEMDGDVILGAIGRANHAGSGSASVLKVVQADKASLVAEIKPGPDGTNGNGWFYGLEVKFDGGQPMTAKQYDSAVRWAAAICDFHGWTAGSVIGHKEWSSRKPDPGHTFMAKFRQDVAARLKAGPGTITVPVTPPKTQIPVTPTTTEDDGDMFITRYGTSAYRMFIDRRLISLSEGTYNILKDGGVPVKQLSNAAVDALASICSNYLTVDDTPTAGTEDAYLTALLSQVTDLETSVGEVKAAVAALQAQETADHPKA